MARRGWVVLVEAFLVLLLVAGLSSAFYFSYLDSKKDFYRSLIANDFAEVSVKSGYLQSVKEFDVNSVKNLFDLYYSAGNAIGVTCVKFGFDDLTAVGSCSGKAQFFSASRSVFTVEGWKTYSVVLGFD